MPVTINRLVEDPSKQMQSAPCAGNGFWLKYRCGARVVRGAAGESGRTTFSVEVGDRQDKPELRKHR